MPLLPFASVAEVQALAPQTSEDLARLAVLLASGSIRNAVRWDVDLATETYTRMYRPLRTGVLGGLDPALTDGHTLSRRESCSVTLPRMHVTAVASVVVDDVVLTAGQWDATESGIVYLNGIWPARKVAITYTSGYVRFPEDEAPTVFKEVCLGMALDLAGNPERVRSYSIGGDSESLYPPIDADEDCRLDLYRVEP